jgi:hypothetical protein
MGFERCQTLQGSAIATEYTMLARVLAKFPAGGNNPLQRHFKRKADGNWG